MVKSSFCFFAFSTGLAVCACPTAVPGGEGCNEGQSLNPCWVPGPPLPQLWGFTTPFYQQVQPQQGAATAQIVTWGQRSLLFGQSIALDVIPFPKKQARIWGRKISCRGFGGSFFPGNKGRKSSNDASELCHHLTEAGAWQTHRHIVQESAISFPFFPLVPLRKGQGKASLQNKLVSQKRGSSADGSVVLHTLGQLRRTVPHPQPVHCPDVLFQTPGTGKVASLPLSPKSSC